MSLKYRVFLLITLIIISIISLFIGAYDININGILNDSEQLMLLFNSRLPRLMAILLSGMGLSVAGLIMQNLLMNKFVSPSTGATISSAQLGIIIALSFIPSASLYQRTIFAFVFSVLGTLLFVYFVQRIKIKDVVMVPLIGIMFNTVIGAFVSHLAYEQDLTQVLNNVLVGDFSTVLAGRYEIVFIVLPLIVVAAIYATHFNIAGLGENFTKNLGLNFKFVTFLGLMIASVISASVVVTVGTISYVGLIIPNLVSMFKGDKIKNSLFDVAVFGALFVLVSDIFGRLIIKPYELPVELTIGVIGSIVFLYMLFKRLKTAK